MLAIALIIALGAVGVTYSAWVDEIAFTGSLSTSDIYTTLECGTCSVDPATTGTSIGCATTADPTQLTITVTNAQYNATPALNPHYYCEFTVSNAVNSFLPVTVASRSITNYTGVYADIELLPVGTVIAPGGTATGKVHIYLTDVGQLYETLPFTLTVVVN